MFPHLLFLFQLPWHPHQVGNQEFKTFASIKTFNSLLKTASCCCFVVSAGERAVGKPNYPTAAGERHPEGCSQLCHQPDGEQVSVVFSTRLADVPMSVCWILRAADQSSESPPVGQALFHSFTMIRKPQRHYDAPGKQKRTNAVWHTANNSIWQS